MPSQSCPLSGNIVQLGFCHKSFPKNPLYLSDIVILFIHIVI